MSEADSWWYGVGFSRFSQLEDDCKATFIPKSLPERRSVLCASWDAVVFQNVDGTFTIKGGGLVKQETTLSKQHVHPTKCGHFHKEKFYLVNNDGKLERYIYGVLDEENEQMLSSLNSYAMKEVFSTVNPECMYGQTETGELYRWNDTSLPTQIFLPKRVTKLGCGISHCLALVQDGTIFSWGTGSRGQLGHSVLEDEDKPRLIDILCGVSIKSIAAGGWHSLALAETGDVYVWGWNECGQLGFPVVDDLEDRTTPSLPSSDKALQNNVAMLNSPTLLELEKYLDSEEFVSVEDISCATRHTGIVTSRGEAVTWGWGKYGQLAQRCCISSHTEVVVTTDEMGVKKAKLNGTSVEDCCEKPHLPGYVEYFTSEGMAVLSVYCVAWNTFFKTVQKL